MKKSPLKPQALWPTENLELRGNLPCFKLKEIGDEEMCVSRLGKVPLETITDYVESEINHHHKSLKFSPLHEGIT